MYLNGPNNSSTARETDKVHLFFLDCWAIWSSCTFTSFKWMQIYVSVDRYRSGGGKSQNQLTVEELRSFVNQLYDLPCTIRQAPFLKVPNHTTAWCNSSRYLRCWSDIFCLYFHPRLFWTVSEQFQQQSSDILAEDMPGSSALQSLLDEGAGLDVELPQLVGWGRGWSKHAGWRRFRKPAISQLTSV